MHFSWAVIQKIVFPNVNYELPFYAFDPSKPIHGSETLDSKTSIDNVEDVL